MWYCDMFYGSWKHTYICELQITGLIARSISQLPNADFLTNIIDKPHFLLVYRLSITTHYLLLSFQCLLLSMYRWATNRIKDFLLNLSVELCLLRQYTTVFLLAQYASLPPQWFARKKQTSFKASRHSFTIPSKPKALVP